MCPRVCGEKGYEPKIKKIRVRSVADENCACTRPHSCMRTVFVLLPLVVLSTMLIVLPVALQRQNVVQLRRTAQAQGSSHAVAELHTYGQQHRNDNTVPHAEYPRPQLQRDGWVTLNGWWEWQEVRVGIPPGTPLQRQVCVPFVESRLSGLALGSAAAGLSHMDIGDSFTASMWRWPGAAASVAFAAVDWRPWSHQRDPNGCAPWWVLPILLQHRPCLAALVPLRQRHTSRGGCIRPHGN